MICGNKSGQHLSRG